MLTPFISEFNDYCKNLNLAQNSIKELVRYINQLNIFLKDYPLKEVKYLTYKHLIYYVIHDAPKATTIKMRIWALKKFFAFLHLQDYIKENIANELKTPKIPKKETAFLNNNELKIIIEYLIKNLNKSNGWRDFLIILLMAVCGLRKSSVVAIDKTDFDQQNKCIFISKKGNRLAIRTMEDNFKKLLEASGLNKDFKVTPHILRNSCATLLNENQVKILTIQNILGHSNPNTTINYYLHTTEQKMRDALEKLPLTLFLNELINAGEIILSFQSERYRRVG